MSIVHVLIARRTPPESVLEALPQIVEDDPFPLDIGLTAHYSRHWTGKTILTFLYADKILPEEPMYNTLSELYDQGKIDRVEYYYQARGDSTRSRFSIRGNWLRGVV